MKRALLLALIAIGAGCEDPSSPTPAPKSPGATTTPAPASLPATTTAATVPAAVIKVNGTPMEFPSARLRVEEENDKVVALLFSDDPREALKDNYKGNSFYIRMELDISDTTELSSATWHYAAPSAAEREDSPYGIFLTGRAVQLRPFKVDAAFRQDENVTIVMVGQFEVIDDKSDHGPPRMMPVETRLVARIDRPKNKD